MIMLNKKIFIVIVISVCVKEHHGPLYQMPWQNLGKSCQYRTYI